MKLKRADANERKRIRELADQGLSWAVIAKRMGLSAPTIRRIANQEAKEESKDDNETTAST